MSQINFPSTVSTRQLTVRSNTTWQITAQSLGSGANFVKINGSFLANEGGIGVYSGSGNENVEVQLTANDSGSNRTVQLDLLDSLNQQTSFTLFQSKAPILTRIFTVNANGKDSGKLATQKYNFTSNGTGSDIEFPNTTITTIQPSEFVSFSDFEGQESIPVDFDNIDMKANRIGSTTIQPFIPSLRNTMSYLITDEVFDPNNASQFSSMLSQATSVTPTLATDVYTSSFTYIRNSKSHLYLIYNYSSEIPAGSAAYVVPAGTSNGATINVKVNFLDRIGRVVFNYNANTTSKTFILKQNDIEIFNTGAVTGTGSVNFFKGDNTNNIYDLEVLTAASDDGWEITPNVPTLTSFSINSVGTTLANVCSSTASDTLFHSGSAALPAVGDVIYTDGTGQTAFNGNDEYYKVSTNDYALINPSGLVVDTGDCSPCAETAIPVISSTSFTFEQGKRVGLSLVASNNPISYALVSTCNNYTLTGGSSGSSFTVVDCITGVTNSVTVMSGSSLEICSSSTPVLVSGDGTITSEGVCSDEILPPGISFNTDNGSLSGSSVIPGTYPIVVTATNCFGTSVNTTITITVNPAIILIRFNMDISNPQDTSSLACGVTPSFVQMFHSGRGTYPLLNDFIFTLVNGKRVVYNGGDKHYITDELTGGKNNILRVDGAGQVVEKTVCP